MATTSRHKSPSRSSEQCLELLDKQIDLLESRDRVVGFIGGYGSGKSYGGAAKALQLAIDNPGKEGMIVAPTNRMLERVALPAFQKFAKPLIVSHNKHSGRIDLANGSIVWLGSVDSPGSVEGSNLAWVWGDEARLWDPAGEAFRILLGRVRVGDAPRLQMVLTTTPLAGGWLEREFNSGLDGRKSIHASSRENHFLDEHFVDNLLSSYSPEQVRAYVDGEWVVLEGAVFPEFDRERHIIDYEPDPSLPVFAGVDFGFRWPAVAYMQRLDRPRSVGGQLLPAGSVIVFEEDTTDNMSTEALGRRMAQRFSDGQLRLEWLACDPAGASHSSSASEHGSIMDVLALKNGLSDGGQNPHIRYLRGQGTAILRSVNTGIEKMRGMLCNAKGERRLYFARSLDSGKSYRGLLRALPSYVYKPGTSIPLKGLHANQADHILDAVRYAVRHMDLRGATVESYA